MSETEATLAIPPSADEILAPLLAEYSVQDIRGAIVSVIREENRKRAEKRSADAVYERKLAAAKRIANEMPVVPDWASDREPKPFGCVLDSPDSAFPYCGGCPADELCPYPHKRYGK